MGEENSDNSDELRLVVYNRNHLQKSIKLLQKMMTNNNSNDPTTASNIIVPKKLHIQGIFEAGYYRKNAHKHS